MVKIRRKKMKDQGGSTVVNEAGAPETATAGAEEIEGSGDSPFDVDALVGDDAPPVWEVPPPKEPLEVLPPYARPDPPADMFVPLAEQLDNVRRWNDERGWGFAPSDFDAIDLTPATHDDPLVVDLIAVYLPGDEELNGVRRTCDELWAAAAEQYENAWCWDQKCWDEKLVARKHVRLLYGIAHQPGIRRVTVDLGVHWEPNHPTRSIDVRTTGSAAAEVLAAAAHFPRWVRSMDGMTVPYVQLSGYQITLVEAESWRRLPCLSWNESRKTLSLTAHWSDIFAPRWSSPVCLNR